MAIITHENILKSERFSELYPDIDITLFYRDLFGCCRTKTAEGRMSLCQTVPTAIPNEKVIFVISPDGTIATVTGIQDMKVTSCENCVFIPKKRNFIQSG